MTEIAEERALVRAEPAGGLVAGGLALGSLTEAEFEERLKALAAGQARLRRIQTALMQRGTDYGEIPGTTQPTLLKPGAEKLCLAYGYVARIEPNTIIGNGFDVPSIRVDSTCYLHAGTWDGPVIAVGYGTANTWESKYRYRKQRGSKVCPECNRPGLILTKRNMWWHPADAQPDGGCGANFKKDDPAVAASPTLASVTLENPDPYELANTILKMSEKRAFIDATLRATATSGLFTQDLEDLPPDRGGPPPDMTYVGYQTGGNLPPMVEATTPDGRTELDISARKEFREWIAEQGIDSETVVRVGAQVFPDRDLKSLKAAEYGTLRLAIVDAEEGEPVASGT